MRKKPKGDTSFEVSGIFADPEVGRLLHEKGLIADANKSSIEELATITSLGRYFHDNKVITQFPELKYLTGVTSLYLVFADCKNLTTVGDIPEGVTNLTETFYECPSLATAPVISSSVTNTTRTFYNCSSIDGIYIIKAETPPKYDSTFYNAKVQAIYVPDKLVNEYKRSSGWWDYASKIYPMSQYPK